MKRLIYFFVHTKSLLFVTLGFVLTLFICTGMYQRTNYALKSLKASSDAANQIHETLFKLQILDEGLSQAAYSIASYTFALQAQYLTAYKNAVQEAKSNMPVLKQIAANLNEDPAQLYVLEKKINHCLKTMNDLLLATTQNSIDNNKPKKALILAKVQENHLQILAIRKIFNNIRGRAERKLAVHYTKTDKEVTKIGLEKQATLFLTLCVVFLTVIVVSIDQIRQQKVQQRLTRLNADKDLFFSIVSHDLRSPFSGITGNIYMLRKHYYDLSDSERLDIINALHESSVTYTDLLKDTLNWALLQMNRFKPLPQKLILHKAVDNILNIFANTAYGKNLRFDNRIRPDIALLVDKDMLHSVIRNLVSNAIKFTPVGGQITFDAFQDNDTVSFTVNDNGVGMKKEKLVQLFEHNNLHSTVGTDNERGTGLGLAFCKEFVEKNGGKISAVSYVGSGTTFTITFPNYLG